MERGSEEISASSSRKVFEAPDSVPGDIAQGKRSREAQFAKVLREKHWLLGSDHGRFARVFVQSQFSRNEISATEPFVRRRDVKHGFEQEVYRFGNQLYLYIL